MEVDYFDEAFDKQHELHFNQQQQYFDVNMEMGKACEDVEEMNKFEPADIKSQAEDRRWSRIAPPEIF